MKKNRNVENYEQLEKNVENAINKVKSENCKIISNTLTDLMKAWSLLGNHLPEKEN